MLRGLAWAEEPLANAPSTACNGVTATAGGIASPAWRRARDDVWCAERARVKPVAGCGPAQPERPPVKTPMGAEAPTDVWHKKKR